MARHAALARGAALLALAECGGARGPSLARRLDALLARQTESGFAGSVLVAKGGRVVLDRGYGWADRRHTRRVTPRTRFWIASISKQFTAAAILTLAEEGRLSVDDPIARRLPDVPEDKRAITIEHLLTHTSGLRQRYAADGIVDRGAAMRALLEAQLASPPGRQFSYANDGYNLLAIVVEVVSGEPFERFLRRRLLDPAGLSDTGFWEHPGHESVAEIPNPVDEQVRVPNWGFRGATGMFSTTTDLHRWHRALSAGRVLSEASRGRLLAPHVAIQDGSAACGWFRTSGIGGRPTLWTRGTEGFGHNAILMIYPAEDVVIVAASNAGERNGVAVTRALADELAAAVFAPAAVAR